MASPLGRQETAAFREALQENNYALLISKIRRLSRITTDIPLNIGVTGESGSGKSSFVNAFRGVDHRDRRAAPTGCVETTITVKDYPHPNYPNVKLWDLPGIGTTRFPADKYLKHVGFEKYDFFIIVSSTRFRENDVTLAKEIQKMGKKFYFARSKIDDDLRSAKRSQRDFNTQRTFNHIRQYCIDGLKKEGLKSPQVFLLSNFDTQLYDFCHLREIFERELDKHKINALLCAVNKISLEVINEKKDDFKNKISNYALLSAAGAALPVPGLSVAVDGSLMVTVVNQYKVGFGLDRPSLKRLAESTGVELKELTAVIQSPIVLQQLNAELILKLLCQSATIAALIAAEESLHFIPIFGMFIAGTLSYKVTEQALESFLNMLGEDAERVLKRALRGLNTSV